MKKIVLVLVMIVSVFALASCGNDSTDPLADGVLTVGMDLSYPPFEGEDINGMAEGISVDLAYELGRYLDVKVEIVNLEFNSLIASLNTKKIDVIIASMSITDERKENINFSEPYFEFPIVSVINKDFFDSQSISSAEDLFAISGVNYVAPLGFFTVDVVDALATDPNQREVPDNNAAVLEVTTGQSDVFVISPSSAALYHNQNPETTVLLWDPITVSPIGMGTRKTDDPAFLESLNEFIAQLGRAGGTYDRLSLLYDDKIAEEIPGQTLDLYIPGDE